MARPLRLEYPGALYHVTARGNAKQDIYLTDADRQTFLDMLGREVEQQRWRCRAWCLMDNHYHLLLETPEPNLARGMRRLNSAYGLAFNRRHGRVGHVFQGRYKSIIVDRESYLLELTRYIVLNPVRAGLVQAPEDWRWSSYAATLGRHKPPDWFAPDSLLASFGRTQRAARRAYRRFVEDGLGAPSPWGQLRGQIWLGDDDFRERMEGFVGDDPADDIPSEHRHPARPQADDIAKRVCRAYELPRSRLFDRSHREAFRATVFLLRRAANLPLKEVARIAGVSSPRVSQIQREMERKPATGIMQKLLGEYKVKI